MLNKENQRELCYVVTIDEIRPIPNYDRVEHARVGGWWVIVQKGQFNVGDPAIYFEIDSKVPSDKECFAFLEKRNYKVKTLRMCKVISQGLLMHAEDFGWSIGCNWDAMSDGNSDRKLVAIIDETDEFAGHFNPVGPKLDIKPAIIIFPDVCFTKQVQVVVGCHDDLLVVFSCIFGIFQIF